MRRIQVIKFDEPAADRANMPVPDEIVCARAFDQCIEMSVDQTHHFWFVEKINAYPQVGIMTI